MWQPRTGDCHSLPVSGSAPWHNILALAYLFGDDLVRALKFATVSLQVRPTWRPAIRTAAAACAALGRDDQALQWARQWETTPALSADALAPLWRCNPAWAQRIERLVRTRARF